jgi:hypothetical protein
MIANPFDYLPDQTGYPSKTLAGRLWVGIDVAGRPEISSGGTARKGARAQTFAEGLGGRKPGDGSMPG